MTTDGRKEIVPVLDDDCSVTSLCDGLPALPCGWIVRNYVIGGKSLQLTVPDRPDMLLDDANVREANQQDDYMPYWAYLWPSAIAMAEAVLKAAWPAETRVLELGCGVGLVGLAALASGCRVTMTDYEAKSVAVARHNAHLNGFEHVIAFELDWRTPPGERFPVILGCDLLYEERNLDPILNLLDVMLEPGGICWLADAGRKCAQQFLSLATKRGYAVTIRDSDGRVLDSPGFHYQLFALTRSGETQLQSLTPAACR